MIGCEDIGRAFEDQIRRARKECKRRKGQGVVTAITRPMWREVCDYYGFNESTKEDTKVFYFYDTPVIVREGQHTASVTIPQEREEWV
jgi:hypothetical protein